MKVDVMFLRGYLTAVLFSLLFVIEANGQRPEVYCANSLNICSPVIVAAAAYNENLNINEINGMLSCLNRGSLNGVWYSFTAKTSGILNFTVKPETVTDDYDWSVYNVTNSSCEAIYTNASLEIGCNYSSQRGSNGYTGPNGTVGPQFGPTIPVVAGNQYKIFVSFYNKGLYLIPELAADHGFTLDLSASTLSIFESFSTTASGDVSICQGSSTQLMAAPVQTASHSVQWLPTAGLSEPGIANPIASPLKTTTYTATVKDLNTACIATPTIVVTVQTPPLITDLTIKEITCAGFATGEITFDVSEETSPNTAILYGGKLPNNGATLLSSEGIYKKTGLISETYVLIVKSADGCESKQTFSVVNANPVRDYNLCFRELINIYPHPSFNTINVELPLGDDSQYTVELISMSGAYVRRQSSINGNTIIDVSDLSSGLYILYIKKDKYVFIKKVEVLRR